MFIESLHLPNFRTGWCAAQLSWAWVRVVSSDLRSS
jgi:hypothetical protein